MRGGGGLQSGPSQSVWHALSQPGLDEVPAQGRDAAQEGDGDEGDSTSNPELDVNSIHWLANSAFVICSSSFPSIVVKTLEVN